MITSPTYTTYHVNIDTNSDSADQNGFDLYSCDSCGAIIPTDRSNLHSKHHKIIDLAENHAMSYPAGYGED